jgi:hypothetical protein
VYFVIDRPLDGHTGEIEGRAIFRARRERYRGYLNGPELEPKIRAIPLSNRSRIGCIEVIL